MIKWIFWVYYTLYFIGLFLFTRSVVANFTNTQIVEFILVTLASTILGMLYMKKEQEEKE